MGPNLKKPTECQNNTYPGPTFKMLIQQTRYFLVLYKRYYVSVQIPEYWIIFSNSYKTAFIFFWNTCRTIYFCHCLENVSLPLRPPSPFFGVLSLYTPFPRLQICDSRDSGWECHRFSFHTTLKIIYILTFWLCETISIFKWGAAAATSWSDLVRRTNWNADKRIIFAVFLLKYNPA